MTESNTRPGLTVLFEFNCRGWRPKGTIWLYPGLVGHLLDSDDSPGMTGSTRPLRVGRALRLHRLGPSADVTGGEFPGATLARHDLRGPRADGANFAGAQLDGMSLVGASIIEADLTEVSLRGTRLQSTDPEGPDTISEERL